MSTDQIITKLKAAAKKRSPAERAANIKRLQAALDHINRRIAEVNNG